MYSEQNEECKPYAWRTVSGFVLAWEGIAAISKAHKGSKEIPYITEVVRASHPVVRFGATALVTVVVFDHFNKRKVF